MTSKEEADRFSRMLSRLVPVVQRVEYTVHKWVNLSMPYCIVQVFVNLMCNDISNQVQTRTSLEIKFVPYLVLLTISTFWLLVKYKFGDHHKSSTPTSHPLNLSAVVSMEPPMESATESQILEEIEGILSKILDKYMGCSKCKSASTVIPDPAPKASSPFSTMVSKSSQAKVTKKDHAQVMKNGEEEYMDLENGLQHHGAVMMKSNISKILEKMEAKLSLTVHQFLERLDIECSWCSKEGDKGISHSLSSLSSSSCCCSQGCQFMNDVVGTISTGDIDYTESILKSSRYPPENSSENSLHLRRFLTG
ncbi:unnamed protein product [Calypogeia fissa]